MVGRPGNEANVILHLAGIDHTKATIPDSYTALEEGSWIFYAPISITINSILSFSQLTT